MPTRKDLIVEQGRTFRSVVRWEVEPLVYRPITAITRTAPPVMTVPAHGMPNGWRAAVVDVVGMVEMNAKKNPPALADYRRMTVVDASTVTVDELSAAAFKAYTSGGYLAYFTPADLASFTARMSIKNKVGGTVLASLTSVGGAIVVDDTLKTITLVLSATVTAAYTWASGVYDLEMVSPAGVVTAILYGNVTLTKEVTS